MKKNKHKKENKPKPTLALSEIDGTLIQLQSLFQNKEVVVIVNLNLHKERNSLVRTFNILDCYVVGENKLPTQKPDYLG